MLAYFMFIYFNHSVVLILIQLTSIKNFKANKTLVLIIKSAEL